MALFALSLLVGGLLGLFDRVYPELRASIPTVLPRDPLRVLTGVLVGLVALIVLYVLLWLHYFDVEAPSHKFRLFFFFKRALQFAPLMVLGAVVGFEAVRWLNWLSNRHGQQQHVVVHGAGVGAAAVLVLLMFAAQDPNLGGLIKSVNTPVFSVELSAAAKREEAPSTLRLAQRASSGSAAGVEENATVQAINLLRVLHSAIRRDISYAENLSSGADPTSGKLSEADKALVGKEAKFYEAALAPVANCLEALRERVLDKDPLILVDHELGRGLRVAHRLLLDNSRTEFEQAIHGLLRSQLPALFDRMAVRRVQHRLIKPVFDGDELNLAEIDKCAQVTLDPFKEKLLRHLADKGFTRDTPYFSIVVAALLGIMGEQRAAAEELDAWISLHKKRRATSPAAAAMLWRVLLLRAQFNAATITATSAEMIEVTQLRLRDALRTTDEILRSTTIQKSFPAGATYEALLKYANSRKDAIKVEPACQNLQPDLHRMFFVAVGISQTIAYLAVSMDDRETLRAYSNVMGYIELQCFNKFLNASKIDIVDAGFLFTYLNAKLSNIRQMPSDRAKEEICVMAGAVDRANTRSADLDREAQIAAASHDYNKAAWLQANAAALRELSRTYNEVVLKVGPRAC